MKTISCFSYKGGAGRSTLAINVVPFLAEKLNATVDQPLVLVDLDVDSCGLTFLFDLAGKSNIANMNVQHLFGKSGVVAPADDDGDILDHDVLGNLFPVGKFFGFDDRAILCLPAQPQARLSETDKGNYDYSDKNFSDFVRVCRDYDCAGILFDAPVGGQCTAGWANQYASHIMCVMRPTQQFRRGTDRFFDDYDRSNARGQKIIVIPNVVPTDPLKLHGKDANGNDEVRSYPDYARDDILHMFSDNIERRNNEYNLELVSGEIFGIPKVDRFMWQEGILRNVPRTELNQQERDALKQYEKVADIISKS